MAEAAVAAVRRQAGVAAAGKTAGQRMAPDARIQMLPQSGAKGRPSTTSRLLRTATRLVESANDTS